MKIQIRDSQRKNIYLKIPNIIIFNSLTCLIVVKVLSKHKNKNISYKVLKTVFKEMKQSVKKIGHYTLIDIESQKGQSIKIIL